MALTQRALHQALRTEALANHQRITALARPLDPEQLVRRPSPTSWSVGEVLEHLCNTDERYRKPLAAVVLSARRDAGAPARVWKSSLLGGLLARSLEGPRPMKAPKSLHPTPTPRNGVLEDFLGRDARVIALMDDAATLDWNALKIAPPLAPWLPLKFNLGDVFRIHVVHVRRHLAQMERAVPAS